MNWNSTMKNKKRKINRIKFAFCHRRTDRTLKFKGIYFPVCARCTGIYAGIVCILLIFKFIYFTFDIRILLIASIMILPTAIDGITQLLKLRESTNFIRFVTGFFCGIGYAIFVLSFFKVVSL